MLKWIEVPLSDETRKFTEQEFVVFAGVVPLLTIGFKRETLITREYYIWIKPTKYLKGRHIRPIRRALEAYNGCILMANVPCSDKIGCRFAEALGFVPRKINDTTLCYERNM